MKKIALYINQFLNKTTIISGLSVLVLFIILRYLKAEEFITYYLSIAIVAILFYTLQKRLVNLTLGLAFGLLAFSFLNLGLKTYHSFEKIPVFDYRCLYHFGKIGVSGGNFYDPENSIRLNDVSVTDSETNEFMEEIVKVGFWYPPPTMFIFAPIGFLDVSTAYLFWMTFITASLLISLFVLLKLLAGYFQNWIYILIIISLFLVYPATRSTISFSQTNFLLLLFLIMTIINMDNWKAGVFLVFATIVKPVALIWGIYFVIFKKYKILTSIVVTGVIVSLITILVFGFDQFSQYLISPPTKRIPAFNYDEEFNVSLSATLIRFSKNFSIEYPSNLLRPFQVAIQINPLLSCKI